MALYLVLVLEAALACPAARSAHAGQSSCRDEVSTQAKQTGMMVSVERLCFTSLGLFRSIFSRSGVIV